MKILHLFLFLLISSIATSQAKSKDSEKRIPVLFQQMTDSVLAGNYEEITSILVAKDGEMIYEEYFNGADVDTKHNVRSGTKTIATLLTGVALEKGYISSVDEPIMKYLKHKLPVQNPDPRKEAIAIEDLLTMSSCLECNDDEPQSRGNEMRMYVIEDWTQFYLDLPHKSYPWGPTPETAEYGRVFSYCSAGAACVSEVIQSAAGRPSADILEQEILKPLGITDYVLHYNPEGTLNTAGGSEYRSRDLMKLIQMMADGGQWEGQEIISAEFLKAASSPKANAWEGKDYGYLMWLGEYGEEEPVFTYAMAGNGGQKIMAIPDLDLTVVMTTTNYNNRRAHGYTDELLDLYIIPATQAMD